MYKILALIIMTAISGCTEEKKVEQVIIPKIQLDALQKAKDVESQLLKAQQKVDKQIKDMN